MKYGILISILSLFLFSCSQPPAEIEEQDDKDTSIIGKWKLQIHEKKEISNKEIDLKSQPTQVILSILDGGYFVLYDTFVDPRFDQKGFSRISERSKGQWEFLDDEKLILRHNSADTSMIEELTITLLNKNTLVTKGKDKKSTIYKTYLGY